VKFANLLHLSLGGNKCVFQEIHPLRKSLCVHTLGSRLSRVKQIDLKTL